jgi:hypothetical protein
VPHALRRNREDRWGQPPAEERARVPHRDLRVPKILISPFPEILITCR